MPTKAQSSRPAGIKRPAAKLPIRANINWLNTQDDGNIRATASMTIGGAFAVHGIRVVNSVKGEFVSMPGYKKGDEYKDTFHAITADARSQMNDAVMQAYEQQLAEHLQNQEQDQGLRINS